MPAVNTDLMLRAKLSSTKAKVNEIDERSNLRELLSAAPIFAMSLAARGSATLGRQS
jgi:hypothetical protein